MIEFCTKKYKAMKNVKFVEIGVINVDQFYQDHGKVM